MLHRRTKRAAIGFLLLGAVCAAVLSGTARFVEAQREKRRSEVERKELVPPPPVPVAVESRPLERRRKFTADIRPWMRAQVPAEVAGRVERVFVEAGTPVKAGDPLVGLDTTRIGIAVDSAEVRSAEAERLLQEAGRLRQVNAISATAYEAAAAEARLAKSTLDEARDTLARHTVRAPFDGTVNARFVDVGDAVNVNQPAVEVVDLEKLRVGLLVSDTDLPAFKVGAKVPLQLASGHAGPFEPVVAFVGRSADPETRLFAVEAVLDNIQAGLPGGLQGFVEADVELFPEGPVVPAAAVRIAGADAVVLKETPDGPSPVKIRVGPEIDGMFPVLGGLRAGDRVFIQ